MICKLFCKEHGVIQVQNKMKLADEILKNHLGCTIRVIYVPQDVKEFLGERIDN